VHVGGRSCLLDRAQGDASGGNSGSRVRRSRSDHLPIGSKELEPRGGEVFAACLQDEDIGERLLARWEAERGEVEADFHPHSVSSEKNVASGAKCGRPGIGSQSRRATGLRHTPAQCAVMLRLESAGRPEHRPRPGRRSTQRGRRAAGRIGGDECAPRDIRPVPGKSRCGRIPRLPYRTTAPMNSSRISWPWGRQ